VERDHRMDLKEGRGGGLHKKFQGVIGVWVQRSGRFKMPKHVDRSIKKSSTCQKVSCLFF